MQKDSMLVMMPTRPEHLAALQQAAPGHLITRVRPEQATAEQLARADLIVGNPPPDKAALIRRARLVQLNSSGVPPQLLTLRESAPGTVLCSASGAYGPAISEHMMGALLGLMKRLFQYRDDQHRAAWIDRGDVVGLRGARVLMIGLGDIGGHFARLCAAFGAEVTGVRRRPGDPPEGVARVITMEELDRWLPWADVVALALPDTPQTRLVIDARRLGLMRPGGFLLNVGRGGAVQQEALLQALESGRLAGASIDVTEPEPLPPEHPLWKAPNLLITPHVSGKYHLRLTHDLVIDMACRNIRALPDGPFVARVDFDSGYRA